MTTAAYRCRVLTDASAWEEVAPWWETLLAASPPGVTPWQGLDYVTAWWRHLRERKQLRLVIVERDGRPCLAMPLQVSTRFEMIGMPVRILEPVAMIMDVNRPRLALGALDPEAYRVALDALWERRREWHLIRIDEKPADDPETGLLREFAARRGLWYRDIYSHPCPYLDLRQDWERYLGTRSRRLRKNLRAAQRRLEALGEIRLQEFREPVEIAAGLEQVVALHHRSWKRHRRIEQSRSVHYQDLYRDWLEALAARQAARVLVLSCGGRPIAATIAVMDDDTYYSAQIVHDEAFDSASPGTLLESLEIAGLMRDRRYATYDFLGAFLGNKRRWTETARDTSLVFVMQPTLATRLIEAYYFHAKPWIKQHLCRLAARIDRE